MDKQKKNQGPIINSQRRDLKPYDYSRLQKLKDKTGVSLEYLKECEEIHKKSLKNRNNNQEDHNG